MEEINKLNSILNSFKIKADCVNYRINDNYFYYDLRLTPSVKIKDIQKNAEEIALALMAPGKPSIKTLFEEGVVRLEFAKPRTTPLYLRDQFSRLDRANNLNCLLGKQSNGQEMWMDLAQNPHMIVSGTTGSGKSVLLHTIIANVLAKQNVDLHLVDPKNIEFSAYRGAKNTIVYNDYKSAVKLLDAMNNFMEMRYDMIRAGYHESYMNPVLLIIDEFADLILQDKNNELYKTLCKLAQKSRAAKINIVLATQRPSANIINGTIKANFPARISCKTSSHVDSKVVLDSVGAENLLGKGDALLKDNLRNLDRFQVAYTTAQENIRYFRS